jgi:hypothetical protein
MEMEIVDEEIRQLERLAASGDVEASHRLLRKQFITGQLDPTRIFIAETDPRGQEFVLAYRLQPEDGSYQYHGRWIPDAEEYVVGRLVGLDRTGPMDRYLVYCEEVAGAAIGGYINYDTENTLFYDEDPALDAFIEDNFDYPAQLINAFENDGLIILRRPIFLQQIDSRSLYHPYYYDKDDIIYNETNQGLSSGFSWQEITIVAKDPGEAPKLVTLWNRLENFQLMCNEGTLEYDMDYYWGNSSTRSDHGDVETEKMFDNVYMLVPEHPWDKEPNFNIFRAPAVSRDHPRVVEMLEKGQISGNVEALFQPQVQTIMGTVAFVKLVHEGVPDWDSLRWPWNEVAKEQGYPAQMEFQGLSEDDIDKVMQFLATGVKPDQ